MCCTFPHKIEVISFVQNVTASYYANPVKRFLLTTFGVDKVVSRGYKITWPPCSADLIPANF
ncbi:UNVERIFIED_CONTAM: hypothetical protein NCL1_13582 [Trichonephila clavipes]